MAIFGLSDLHLHINNPQKDMSIFGDIWKNHKDKIFRNWTNTVGKEDIVLISGDISWSLKYEDAAVDLAFIGDLPGKKIMVRGNHDFWWRRKATSKIQNDLENIFLLQGTSLMLDDIWFTGTRGWRLENGMPEDSRKIFDREINYLIRGLEAVPKDAGCKIVLLHYPPFNEDFKHNAFANILVDYKVDMVVYGHIHSGEFMDGNINGVEYRYVAGDYLSFVPRLLLQ